jgi:formylglycine-generating enzyme required for sulfatase activity
MVLLALLGLVTTGAALAGARVALVIGNGAYRYTDHLQKPVQDAADIAAALKGLGYRVDLVSDADRAGMEASLASFATRAAGADQAIVYYSGFGLEVGGENYLLPVDAHVATEARVPVETVALKSVIGATSKARELGLVVLDASRDSPLGDNMRRLNGARGAGKGLAAMKLVQGNQAVAFAARAGEVAGEAQGRNSAFTAAILDALQVQGLEARTFWGVVRDTVVSETHDAQKPVTYIARSLGTTVYLNPPARPAAAAIAKVEPKPESKPEPKTEKDKAQYDREAELAMYQTAQRIGTPEGYEAYLAQYPKGRFANFAHMEIDRLHLLKAPEATPPVVERPKLQEAPSLPPVAAIRPQAPELPPAVVATPPVPERPHPYELANMAPQTRFQDCPECPEMVRVPTGTFLMGSPHNEEGRYDDEGPVHKVVIGYPLAVGIFPVTRAQWRVYLKSANKTGSGSGCGWENPGYPQSETDPVVCVTWNETNEYAAWLTLRTGKTYRLLSEAEYEFVSRAGSVSPYFWGNSVEDACQYSNTADASFRAGNNREAALTCNDGYVYTSPVGHYRPNPFGLYDIAGNVWSWTADCWHPNYAGAPGNGSAWKSEVAGDCTRRVLRGASWIFNPTDLRSSYRDSSPAASRFVGFRVGRLP